MRKRAWGSFALQADDEVLEHIIAFSQGDARVALNTLEIAAGIAPPDSGGIA